ncbi:MAG TPA: host attachment protein [Micropepsaceae bacterium]|nr:host attachment protein [Micropepsaceae bacterium]
MHKHLRIWVLVMDGGRAQLFVPDEDLTGLHTAVLPELPVADPSTHARDLKSDRPGRSFGSARTGTRHSIEPRHDYHKLKKHDFAAGISDVLERAFAAREFERLVLVAPPRTVGEMRTLLPARLSADMYVIAKDLTKATAAEMWHEVAAIVPRPWLMRAS